MKIICSIFGLGFLMVGILMVTVSYKNNLTINYTTFAAAAFGFGLIGFALIIGLLVAILDELQSKKFNPCNPSTSLAP